jgi:energy-coupling factor transporter ATP-binding protein EcfA2
MRITKVAIPALTQFGLREIEMSRLGKVVLLAGKNGSGKTRLLGRLAAWTQEPLPRFGPRSQLVQWAETHLFPNISISSEQKTGWWKVPAAREFAMTNLNRNYDWDQLYELAFDSQGSPQFAFFAPKPLHLSDAGSLPKNDLLSRAKKAEVLGTGELHNNVLARIQVIQDRRWEATNDDSQYSLEDMRLAIGAYEGLCTLIRRFLSTDLTRSRDGIAELFKMPAAHAKLSDGQNVLLQFCVAVHAQADQLSELIVLMDEPENHLHPGAMLDAISEIQKALTNGQLWIATHSVHLLAHFDPDCIWWMDQGGVRHAGSQPEAVLKSLIGDDERIDKLSSFLGLPAELAANNFAFQCLLPPNVVADASGDPQTSQICSLLRTRLQGRPMRVLDIGAGRGRLASALREGASSFEDVPSQIDYRAFDPSPKHKPECEAAISRLHGSATNRYFNEDSEIRAVIDGSTVNVAVLCNVLHEIDPIEWVQLFQEGGMLRHLLASDGFLLLVEDLEMRVGEMAHDRGFLVLDTADIRALFALPESDPDFAVDDARGNGRLKAHLVPARYLGNVTTDSLKKTLKQVQRLAAEGIKNLRKHRDDPPSYRFGRKHAFHVHQLANAKLALDILGG